MLPEDFHRLVEYGILASRKDPFDPMEKALKLVGKELLSGTEHLHDDWDTLREYPLSGELLAMSCVWEPIAGGDKEIAAKGAPEAIADLCHFSPEAIADLDNQISVMAAAGLRVLGVAKGSLSPNSSRHMKKLPARGQRTKTNSRTIRGNVRKTMSSGKRKTEKT